MVTPIKLIVERHPPPPHLDFLSVTVVPLYNTSCSLLVRICYGCRELLCRWFHSRSPCSGPLVGEIPELVPTSYIAFWCFTSSG